MPGQHMPTHSQSAGIRVVKSVQARHITIAINIYCIVAKANKCLLKCHPDFDERWLRKVIEDEPSIVGLGDLELKA